MRNIKKDFTAIPLSLQGQAKNLINITRTTSLKYDSDDVKIALTTLYHGKCAYCEQLSNLEIDHYRPKTDYFWLEIAWTNLVYSCHDCNMNGSKGRQFPLINEENRIKEPKFSAQGLPINYNIIELDNIEQPLLINPEVTNPYFHVRINKFGHVEEVNNSLRGATTKEVCKLNRDGLHRKRATIINNFITRIRTQLAKRFQPKNALTEVQLKEQLFDIFTDISKQGNKLMEFTMISYSFIRYFDDMILDSFEPEFHSIILDAFLEFCDSYQ